MLLIGAALVVGATVGANQVWVEAEQFSELGGWKIDSQFYDQMGSSYLLAQGLHGPVEDARTVVQIPRAGRWAVWVRTKNWVPEVQPPPGRFLLIVGGKASRELGTLPDSGWRWQQAGVFELPAGPVELRLRDLTGEYGRCDAIFMTTDQQFRPPDDLEGYKRLRFELTGVDDNFKPAGEFDVVVVGGGVAGCLAAVAAARHGASVCLIQDRPVLGGNASTEIRVGVGGASVNAARFSRESGLVEEAWREALRLGSWSAGLEHMVRSAGVNLMLNTRGVGVEMAGPKRIAAVKARDVLTGQGYLIRGKVFIDCTGDGCIGAAAGAEYRVGREGRDEFGESIAPEKPDRITLGTSLLFQARDAGHPVEFKAPAWAYKFENCSDLPYRDHSHVAGGYWWIEWGGTRDTIRDAEEIRDGLLRILYGVWDHIKNHCKYSRKARNLELAWVGIVAGKRESRRLMGDYILTQHDLEVPKLFYDRVAYGGWGIDLHAPRGIFDPGPPNIWVPVPLYSIPFRCLYSRNIENLLMAGRDISVTHVALGSTRLMATCGACGQAVGTAAAMCAELNCTPRMIYFRHMAELQRRLLRDDAHILGMKLLEADNLALSARITASSSAAAVPWTREMAHPYKTHRLDHDRAVRLPVAEGRIDAVWLLLRNDRKQPVEAELEVRLCSAVEELSRTQPAAKRRFSVEPGRRWVRVELSLQAAGAKHAWFVLRKREGLWWYLVSPAPIGAMRAWASAGSEDWHPAHEVYAAVTEPEAPLVTGCGSEMVADGLARPDESGYHGWVSDPSQKLPQWIELRWPRPVEIGLVELVFDTNLDLRRPTQLYEPEVVTDYRVLVLRGGEWKQVAGAKGNYLRLRRHKFRPVRTRALRIEVLKTGGQPAARIFEVRVYARAGDADGGRGE